jgi:hypothetical protein
LVEPWAASALGGEKPQITPQRGGDRFDLRTRVPVRRFKDHLPNEFSIIHSGITTETR